MKGAVLLLEEGEGLGPDEETSPTVASPEKQGGGASDTRHRHLHAMIEQLRPEDSIKLVRPHVSTHIAHQTGRP